MGKKSKAKAKKNNLNSNPIKSSFEKRFRLMLPKENTYNNFIKIILTTHRKSFRINTTKVKTKKEQEQLIKNLKNKGLNITPIPWTNLGFYVNYEKGERIDLGNLYEHFLGQIYIQESTSMMPPLALDIPDKIDNTFKVLDVASSPGSKTTQIGAMMKNEGILIANEFEKSRLNPLKLNIERSGLTNTTIINYDGTKIEGENEFDRIMLDVPCSGSGIMRKNPKVLKEYNPKLLKSISKLQYRLLERSFELLKKGGILVYSTCSLDPEENEFVIQKFLEENKFAELMEVKLEGVIQSNLIKKFKSKEIIKEVYEKTLRIWPQDNNTGGFYIAKIKKR